MTKNLVRAAAALAILLPVSTLQARAVELKIADSFPADHYQTGEATKGTEVHNRPGVTFKALPPDIQKGLTIADGTKPEDIVTKVYWKPGGTPDQNRWVLLMSNQPDPKAIIQLEKRKMSVSYRKAELIAESYDFTVSFNSKVKTVKSPTFKAQQRIGQAVNAVAVSADCADCGANKIAVDLQQDGDDWYFVVTPTDWAYLQKNAASLNGKKFDIDPTLTGRGEAKKELMSFTLTIGR